MVLPLSVFAYLCEAFLGVMPSVALLCHFFSLRVSGGNISACTSFVAYSKSNAISKAGKRAEGFRSKWVMVNAGCHNPLLELPTKRPEAV